MLGLNDDIGGDEEVAGAAVGLESVSTPAVVERLSVVVISNDDDEQIVTWEAKVALSEKQRSSI